MTPSEIIFGTLLVAGLVGLAGFLGWQQVASLRALKTSNLPDEERHFERRKAYRRLVGCAILLAMAAVLAVLLALYEPGAQQIADERDAQGPDGFPGFTEEQKHLLRIWGGSVIVLLILLLGVLVVAGLDIWATRRYAWRQFRKLQADRRAMIERQSIRLRQERNGET